MSPEREMKEVTKLEALLAGEMAERRALERELREREERFNAFFASAPVGLAVVDNGLRYVRVNETLARINGRSVEEHLGRTVREVVPRVAQAIEPSLRRMLETREPLLNLEVSGEAADDPGREHKWLLSFVPLTGAEGRALGIGALVFDVTEHERLERSLDEYEARYRMLLEHSSDAILVFDEEGRFLEVNPKVYRMLGYQREEFLSMRVHDLIPAEDLATTPPGYDELRAGRTLRRQRRLRRKDGTLVQVEIIGSMIGEGKLQCIVRDLSGATDGAEESLVMARSALDEREHVPNGIGMRLLKDLSAALTAAVEVLEESQHHEPANALDIGRGIEFYEEVSRFEARLIERALVQTHGNQKKAAALLGINHTTFHTMMRRYQIDPASFKPARDGARTRRASGR